MNPQEGGRIMSMIAELFLTFARIGAFTFGGGYAMISLIDHECVEKKQWITSEELMDITVIAESTPGPIAINCATYTGYKKCGIAGAVAATVGMVLPSFLIILLISGFFERFITFEIVGKAFSGIRVAVAVLIVQAAVKMIRKMLKKTPTKGISIAFVTVSFAVVFVLNLLGIRFSTIWLILISGFIGYILFSGKQNGGKK